MQDGLTRIVLSMIKHNMNFDQLRSTFKRFKVTETIILEYHAHHLIRNKNE